MTLKGSVDSNCASFRWLSYAEMQY